MNTVQTENKLFKKTTFYKYHTTPNFQLHTILTQTQYPSLTDRGQYILHIKYSKGGGKSFLCVTVLIEKILNNVFS